MQGKAHGGIRSVSMSVHQSVYRTSKQVSCVAVVVPVGLKTQTLVESLLSFLVQLVRRIVQFKIE